MGLAASEEQKVQNFMCALDLINLVYEVGWACIQLLCQMGGGTGPSFLPQDRPTECQELKMDVWVRALLMDKLG